MTTAARGRPTSLVRRLVLLALIWSFAVLLTAGVALTFVFHQAEVHRLDVDLAENLDYVMVSTTVDNGALSPPLLADPLALQYTATHYWMIATVQGNRWVGPQMSRSMNEAELHAPVGGAQVISRITPRVYYYDSEVAGHPVRVAGMQLESLDGYPHPVVFLVARNRQQIDEDSRTFAITIAISVILLSIGLIMAVLIQVRVGLVPLFTLRREVSDVRTGKAERLAASAYPAELEPLADELNALMAHNQEVVERQRTHVGNLAHALKTPISVMMTEASQQPGGLAEIVGRQTTLMQAQVDHHLRRARAAARSQGSGERTQVASVLDEMSRALERIFQDKGVTIEWDAEDELYFAGERQDFMELAGNAMENACKWCKKRVRVTAVEIDKTKLGLTVEDDGAGLPADQRDEVLRRGSRLDENAPGSGLGLSIIHELSKAYGGSVTLGDSRLGGLKVEFILPRSEG